MPRRFRRWPSGLAILAGALLLLTAIRPWWSGRGNSQTAIGDSSLAGAPVALAGGSCEWMLPLNSNTLLVAQQGRQFRVRLLGVSASDDLRARLTLAELTRSGPASIELDKRRAASDGAWLAYVYTDEQLVNAAMLRAGWGRYEPYPGDSVSHGRQLREAMAVARREKLGIWAAR